MPVFYLDTSALVKRYRTELGTEVVEELLGNPRPQDRFFVSFLSIIELTSGVLRLARGGQLREDIAQEILARFRHDVRDLLRVWPYELAPGLGYVRIGTFDETTARARNATYEAPLRVKARLANKRTGDAREQEIYRGEFQVAIPYRRSAPIEQLDLELELQGCADFGLCYLPQDWAATVALPPPSLFDFTPGAQTTVGGDLALSRRLCPPPSTSIVCWWTMSMTCCMGVRLLVTWAPRARSFTPCTKSRTTL